jgi:hypothetical protein
MNACAQKVERAHKAARKFTHPGDAAFYTHRRPQAKLNNLIKNRRERERLCWARAAVVALCPPAAGSDSFYRRDLSSQKYAHRTHTACWAKLLTVNLIAPGAQHGAARFIGSLRRTSCQLIARTLVQHPIN